MVETENLCLERKLIHSRILELKLIAGLILKSLINLVTQLYKSFQYVKTQNKLLECVLLCYVGLGRVLG